MARVRALASAALNERPPHIGLNLIFLVPGETGGMEVAARELIPALVKAAPELRFTAFVNREAAVAKDGPWGELLPAVTVPVNARNRVQWVRGEQQLLPRLAARAGVDLVHSLASTAPARGRFRRVVTVHDLIYARFPEAHAGIRDLGMRVLVPLAVRRSDRVIVDSHSTQRDVVELLGTDAERIDVVPLGIGTMRRDQPLPEHELRERLRLGERPIASEPVGQASAQEPAHADRRACIDPGRAPPLLVLPGYPTEHEARCASVRARPGWRATCASRTGSAARSSRGFGKWRRRSCTRRCTRASACRCWRRWRAACRWPARTHPRYRRSQARRRCCSTPTTSAQSPLRSSAALKERSGPRGGRAPACTRAGASARVHLGAHCAADARELWAAHWAR